MTFFRLVDVDRELVEVERYRPKPPPPRRWCKEFRMYYAWCDRTDCQYYPQCVGTQ